MVYLNNLLSLPLAAALAAATGELAGVAGDPALRRPGFAAAALASALLAFCISFTALWRAPAALSISDVPSKSELKARGRRARQRAARILHQLHCALSCPDSRALMIWREAW